MSIHFSIIDNLQHCPTEQEIQKKSTKFLKRYFEYYSFYVIVFIAYNKFQISMW